MENVLKYLTDKDDKMAYAKAREIAAASEFSDTYYPYLEQFASLLTDNSSYVRTRAFILCCSQARWDTSGKLQDLLSGMAELFHDEKPTVVRQCLNAVKELAVFRPELRPEIRCAVENIDPTRYKSTMSPLIMKDIKDVLELLEEE